MAVIDNDKLTSCKKLYTYLPGELMIVVNKWLIEQDTFFKGILVLKGRSIKCSIDYIETKTCWHFSSHDFLNLYQLGLIKIN